MRDRREGLAYFRLRREAANVISIAAAALALPLILDDEETLDFRKVHVGLFDFAP